MTRVKKKLRQESELKKERGQRQDFVLFPTKPRLPTGSTTSLLWGVDWNNLKV